METKVCSKCGEEKPMTTEYFLLRKDTRNFRNDCRLCRIEYHNSYYKNQPVKEIPSSQKCNVCNVEKNVDDFGFNPASKNGLKGYCKSCEAERSRNRRKKKPKKSTITESALETGMKICNSCNIIKPINDFWKNSSKKVGVNCKCIECEKKYRQETLSEYQYEYQKKYKKDKLNNDPLYRLMKNLSRRIRLFMKKGNRTTASIIGCSQETFRNWIENQFIEGMSWDNHGQKGWQLDHIIPLASAKTEEEIIKLNHYTNLQPLWWKDNLSKGDKLPEEWLNEYQGN